MKTRIFGRPVAARATRSAKRFASVAVVATCRPEQLDDVVGLREVDRELRGSAVREANVSVLTEEVLDDVAQI